jgi:hypothetical protein
MPTAHDEDLTPDRARKIYQTVLDGICKAQADDDFDAYATFFLLPHTVETFDSRSIIETRDDLRMVFAAMRDHLDRAGVIAVTRLCSVAEFAGADTIQGSHETWLVTPRHLIREHYTALSMMVRTDTGWRSASGQYATQRRSMPSDLIEKLTARYPGRILRDADSGRAL